MTIAELEDKLPNGFHDSYLVSVSADFASATCCLEIDVDYDDPDPNVFRRMRLRLRGLSFIAMEPPDPKDSLPVKDTICISGGPTTEKMLPDLGVYCKSAPPGTFFYSFFLRDRNAFIHLAATDASLEDA
jgi:hypothetical protein